MSNDKLSQMQNRLNVSDLDADSRRELFGKFQKAGGQVVNLDEDVNKMKASVSKSTSTKTSTRSTQTSVEKDNPFRPSSQSTSSAKKQVKKQDTTQPTNRVSFFKLFLVRFSCMLANLFNLSATRFTHKFSMMTVDKAYTSNAYIKTCLYSIFAENHKEVIAFRNHVIENELITEYEYAYHMFSLIDEQKFAELKSMMPSVDGTEKAFINIFSTLHFLYSYQQYMQVAITKIIALYEEFYKKKAYKFYSAKRFNAEFLFLWKEWYIWVEELINYYWLRNNYRSSYVSYEEFIKANNFRPIGVLAEAWFQEYQKRQIEETPEGEELHHSTEYPDPNVEKGVLLIRNFIDFDKAYERFQENKDIRSLLGAKDKLFYTYVLIDFFDKEFSLIWNDMSFYVDMSSRGGRFDPKKEIRALQSKLTQFDELVVEYLRTIRSSKTEDKEQQLNKMSFDARKMLSSVVEQYIALFSRLRSPNPKKQDSVGNREEVIVSGKNHEHRILYGYTAQQILEFTYSYFSAIAWLLKYKDLSGLSSNISEFEILSEIKNKNFKTDDQS